MEFCLICHEPTNNLSKNFCDRCLHMSVEQLDQEYGRKESPLSAREDEEEAR